MNLILIIILLVSCSAAAADITRTVAMAARDSAAFSASS